MHTRGLAVWGFGGFKVAMEGTEAGGAYWDFCPRKETSFDSFELRKVRKPPEPASAQYLARETADRDPPTLYSERSIIWDLIYGLSLTST